MDEQLRIILIIIVSVSIFGLLVFVYVKNHIRNKINQLVKEEKKKSIAVIAPAFSSDCIETLEEINEEIRESFEEAGGEEFTYIPCLNDSKAHIDALSALIDKNLSGWIN